MALEVLEPQPILSAVSAEKKRLTFRSIVQSNSPLTVPGVYDGLSARVAAGMGAQAAYLTGYGVSASLLARPDAGYLSLRDVADRTATLAPVLPIPLIVDADTGFGGVINVMDTVRSLESAGAAAIQLEDQVAPKRCGHTLGREVIDTGEMVRKIRAACDVRRDANLMIIARTDARTTLGLDEACRRGEQYLEAGADVLFVESPESADEFALIGRRFAGAALLANMVPGGRSPDLSAEELGEMGFSIILHPGAAMGPVVVALKAAFGHLLKTGTSKGLPQWALEPSELHGLNGFAEVWAQDLRYSAAEEEA